MKNSRATIRTSKITLFGVGLVVSMVVLYLYFLNMSVVHVVMRTEHVQERHHLNTEIADLEAVYIESQHVIASRVGDLSGYNTDTPKIFVSRKQASLVLGSN
jgi:hypothetical protein